MLQEREFELEVFLANHAQLITRFRQRLDDFQAPAARFYLGFSTDQAAKQDLPWIAVGDIAYQPDEVVAVRVRQVDATMGQNGHDRAFEELAASAEVFP
ncbi:MAG: hypothetical protein ACRDHX_05940 [Chloroflexota bacterium]